MHATRFTGAGWTLLLPKLELTTSTQQAWQVVDALALLMVAERTMSVISCNGDDTRLGPFHAISNANATPQSGVQQAPGQTSRWGVGALAHRNAWSLGCMFDRFEPHSWWTRLDSCRGRHPRRWARSRSQAECNVQQHRIRMNTQCRN
eukprot:scaffold91659_cov36-Tisochrysis_lutea.AAC.1